MAGPPTPPHHVAAEFRQHPLGHHSPELQRVLTTFRGAPMAGKYVLLCTKPYQEWKLAQLSGVRGEPPTIISSQVFTDRAAAEWEVFKRRWEQYYGERLDDVV